MGDEDQDKSNSAERSFKAALRAKSGRFVGYEPARLAERYLELKRKDPECRSIPTNLSESTQILEEKLAMLPREKANPLRLKIITETEDEVLKLMQEIVDQKHIEESEVKIPTGRKFIKSSVIGERTKVVPLTEGGRVFGHGGRQLSHGKPTGSNGRG